MQRSTDRILTTHAGSLPRPDDLTALMIDVATGKQVDQAALGTRVRQAVREVVARQREAGVDVISDGEMGKIGFTDYVRQRYGGFGHRVANADVVVLDMIEVPELFPAVMGGELAQRIAPPVTNEPLAADGHEAMDREISDLLGALDGSSPDQAFITAVTPGQVAYYHPNRYYDSLGSYLKAAADLLASEYQAIITAGFNLQLDSPEAAMAHHFLISDGPGPDPLERLEASTDALNQALEGLPPEKIRLHVCWGNLASSHHKDVELSRIIEPILRTRAGFIYVEAANPRHEHEWQLWEQVALPDDKALIPGVIDTNTNRVEHPELVAQRIERFARCVGKERVIAGTDCGFETFIGMQSCAPGVAWLKLRSLAEGARIASQRLW